MALRARRRHPRRKSPSQLSGRLTLDHGWSQPTPEESAPIVNAARRPARAASAVAFGSSGVEIISVANAAAMLGTAKSSSRREALGQSSRIAAMRQSVRLSTKAGPPTARLHRSVWPRRRRTRRQAVDERSPFTASTNRSVASLDRRHDPIKTKHSERISRTLDQATDQSECRRPPRQRAVDC